MQGRNVGCGAVFQAVPAIALAACIATSMPLPAFAKPAAKAPDCAQAKALPGDADAESRRIACEIPAEYQEDVSLAQIFGRELRRHDIAAWLTTDALKEIGAFHEIPGQGQGWLTQDRDDRIEVRYFSEQDFELQAFAQADLDYASAKAVFPRRLQPPQPPTPRELAMLRARNLAMGREALRCSRSINTVILPFERDGRKEIRVYVMSAWTGEKLVFGGHSLYTVSADGKAVLSEYSHTRGCLLFDPPAEDQVGLGVSHLTTPTPNEFHVFLSLQHRMPIYVATASNGLHWKVEDGSISLMQQPEPTPSEPDGRP